MSLVEVASVSEPSSSVRLFCFSLLSFISFSSYTHTLYLYLYLSIYLYLYVSLSLSLYLCLSICLCLALTPAPPLLPIPRPSVKEEERKQTVAGKDNVSKVADLMGVSENETKEEAMDRVWTEGKLHPEHFLRATLDWLVIISCFLLPVLLPIYVAVKPSLNMMCETSAVNKASCFGLLSAPLYAINCIFFIDALAGFQTCFLREIEDADELLEEKALEAVSFADRIAYYWHNDILHDRADALRFNLVLSHRAGGKLISRGDRIAFYYFCKYFPFDFLPCLPLHALGVSFSLSPFSLSIGGNTGREWDWSVAYFIGLSLMLPKLYNLVEGRISHRFDGISIGSGVWILVVISLVGHVLGCLFFGLGAHYYNPAPTRWSGWFLEGERERDGKK